MGKMYDLTGKTFHRLTVLGPGGSNKCGRTWKCVCRCGKVVTRSTSHLNEKNKKQSCGCRGWEYHHDSSTRFYKKYAEAKKRCNNPNVDSYKYYGGRGIKFERKSYEDFKRDMYDDYLEHVKIYGEKNTSLDRINGDGNYCKDNCRWVTREEQSTNRACIRTIYYRGERVSMAKLEKLLGISRGGVGSRLRRGVPLWRIIKHPHKRFYKDGRHENSLKKYS